MFKSVFAKYISAFMLIILISFSLVIGIISVIIDQYSQEAKEDIMETTTEVTVDFFERKLTGGQGNDLRTLVALEAEDIESMLTVASVHSRDMTLLLADRDGTILLVDGKEEESIGDDARIPTSWMEGALDDELLLEGEAIEGVFPVQHAIASMPVHGADGAACGVVLVCADTMMMADLLQVIVKAIVVAILWILLAALLAVYLISDRVIAPLKEISRAAKEFASGKFDVRVSVRGRDEVAELALAFNSMAEAMDNYDNMQNTFMSNVSHDLRSPMTSISGFIDGILDGVIPPEKHHYYLQIVSTEIKRLSRLVSSLLDLSRIQAGEKKFTMASFDICEMGREILISFEQKINERALEVDFYCDEERMPVEADRDAIYQILYNLCDNAIKFSSNGALLQLRIVYQKNRKVEVSVYNEGEGIAPADLPYVFERFYKSDKSRGLNKTGVGLGLFISKTIIDAHGESIWVESEQGKNCCFHFTLKGE